MNSQIPSAALVIAITLLLRSTYAVNPPDKFTWPPNSKNYCFVGQFSFVLNVQYLKNDGTNATVKLPMNSQTYESYSVSCAAPAEVHELTISMLQGFTNVIFQFTLNGTNETSLTAIYGVITMNDKQTIFPNYDNSIKGSHQFWANESSFGTKRGNSYRCDTKTTLTGFDATQNVLVKSIEIESLHVEPFPDPSKPFDNYSTAKVCDADDKKSSNLVPIIVGACLAVLVVVVLVAYLIGRRRSRNGYQTV